MRISDELGAGLSAEDYAHLETLAQARRAAIRQEILDDAKAGIDALDALPAGRVTGLFVGLPSGMGPRPKARNLESE